MIQDQSGGSPGLLVGRYSGYWNTGKGSTWEGGIREAAFANWFVKNGCCVWPNYTCLGLDGTCCAHKKMRQWMCVVAPCRPGKITPATRTSEIVSSMDLFPTVSALAGVELPAGVTSVISVFLCLPATVGTAASC